MQITIDTSTPLTAEEKAALAALLGVTTSTIVTEPAKTPSRPAPAKPAPEPEPEEDLIGDQPTVQDAVDRATELVNSGQQAKVKAALKTIGADRVSNIPASKVADFLAALEG